MDLERIRLLLKKHRKELKEKYGVRTIGIFGSYVRGEQKETSDVDILVEFDKPVDFFEFLELEEYLEEILNVKVDLVLKRSLKPGIARSVLKEVVYV